MRFTRTSRALCALALAFGLASAGTAAAEPRFPATTTQDLNGRTLTFPEQFPAERTLLLIAFYREQQADLDEWIYELDLDAADAPVWLEIPVIEDNGAIFREFVDNGMRSGITSEEARARVFTIYGDPDAFRAALELGSDELVYLLVVDREGRVLHREYGRYSEAKAGPLLGALAE